MRHCRARRTVRRDHRHGLAGVVDAKPLARHMHLAHRALERRRPGAVLDAKARVLVRLFAAALVRLPQQLQRDAGTLELLVNPGVVGLEMAAGARHGGPVQPRLQLLVRERLRDAPVHAGVAGQENELADRALADAHGADNLRVAQAGFKVQAPGLSYLAHRDPVGGHGWPKNRPACPTVKITRAPAQSSTISLKRPSTMV